MKRMAAVVLMVAVSGCASEKGATPTSTSKGNADTRSDSTSRGDSTTPQSPQVAATPAIMCALPSASASKQSTAGEAATTREPPSCQPMKPAEPTESEPVFTPQAPSQTAFSPLPPKSEPPSAVE